MNDISPHFNRDEFTCRCGCGFDTVDTDLIRILEVVRQHFLAPVKVTSGCRCEAHNASVGGSPKSQHVKGRAADIQVKGKEAIEVYEFLNKLYPNSLGLGLASNFVHVDTRTHGSARWTY